MGMGIFLVPVYVYDGRGIRLMWVGQAGLVCLGGSIMLLTGYINSGFHEPILVLTV
jgi:hypothetical protein